MNQWFILGIGFTAQLFFSARLLLQWIMSEKAHRVVSPLIFWQLSLLGSWLLFLYGWLRNDFAIILGQVLSYYVYIRNLQMQGFWQKMYRWLRMLFVAVPVGAIAYMLLNGEGHFIRLFHNEEIGTWLLIYGSLGQIIFTLRFVYQWYYSSKRQESLLPVGFWIISLLGASVIVSYAVFRQDPVLLVGQATGILVYIRNLFILRKEARA